MSLTSFRRLTESLNETAYGKGLVARGKHYLVFGSKSTQNPSMQGRERLLQNQVLVPNWLFFDDVSSTSYDDWMKMYTNIVSLTLKQSMLRGCLRFTRKFMPLKVTRLR